MAGFKSHITTSCTLGAGYADLAGNVGAVAMSENYGVETVTFTVSDGENGSVDFGGTATGPISITLNASNEAVFVDPETMGARQPKNASTRVRAKNLPTP